MPQGSWFDPVLEKLRQQQRDTNSHRLEDYVEVEVLRDEKGWADRWATLFTAVLNQYTSVGTAFRKLRPRFRFDAIHGQQIHVGHDGLVLVSSQADPESRVLGHRFFARWLVLDCLGRLIYFKSSATQEIWGNAFKEEGSVSEEATPENEAAYLFVLAASGPDEIIDELHRAYGAKFDRRWRWICELIWPYLQ